MMNSSMQANLPLAGKRFFIDPKVEKTLGLKVKQMLIELGGKVEEFLDKGIHFALTSEINYEKFRKGIGDNKQGLSPCCESPFNTTQSSQHVDKNSSRMDEEEKGDGMVGSSQLHERPPLGNNWKDLAKQAKLRAPKNVNSIIDTAKSLGIKIRLIGDVISWLHKKTAAANRPSYSASQPAEIKLKSPCLKVEDRNTKPIYEEFESFSHLDIASQGRECPIINVNSFSRKTAEKKKNTRKGFCECCQCSYLNEKKHRKTMQHINYGEKSANFESLDGYLTKHQLTLDSVLRRHASTKNTIQSTSVDFSRKPYVKITNLKSSLDEYAKEESTKQKSPRKKKKLFNSPVTKQSTPPRRKSPRKLVKHTSLEKEIHPSQGRTPNTFISKRINLSQSNFVREQDDEHCHENPATPNQLHTRLRESINTSSEKPCSSSTSKASTHHPTNATPPFSINLRKRKRVRSCESPPENSPLSCLRSSKQKLRFPGLSYDKAEVEFSLKSSFSCENATTLSKDDVMTLLQSSSEREVSEVEFLGF